MENEVAQASARVADIVAAAERAADELYAQAEKRMRERIAEGDRAAHNRVEAAESEAFEAQLQLDAGNYKAADDMAYGAMITAAKTLVQEQWLDVPTDNDTIVNEFKTRFVDTGLFRDKYHLDQFSNYLLNRHAGADTRYTSDTAHKLVEETNLFIDAAHKCHAKVRAELAVNLTAPAAGTVKV